MSRSTNYLATRMITDLAGSEQIESALLANALHASQPDEVNDWIKHDLGANKGSV